MEKVSREKSTDRKNVLQRAAAKLRELPRTLSFKASLKKAANKKDARSVAEDLIKKNAVADFVKRMEDSISSIDNFIKNNPDDPAVPEFEETRKQAEQALKIVTKEVEIVKIEQAIENDLDTINKHREAILNEVDALMDYLADLVKNKATIKTCATKIVSSQKEYVLSIKNVDSKKTKYKELTGNDLEADYSDLYFTIDYLEELYEFVSIEKVSLLDKIASLNPGDGQIAELQDIVKDLDSILNALPNLAQDQDKYLEMTKRVDEQIKKTTGKTPTPVPTSKPADADKGTKKLAETALKAWLEQKYKRAEELEDLLINNLFNQDAYYEEYVELRKEINETIIGNAYAPLTKEEKGKVRNTFNDRYEGIFRSKYGEAVYKKMFSNVDLYKACKVLRKTSESLETAEFGKPEFETKLKFLKAAIDKLLALSDDAVTITLEATTQTIKIKFKDNVVKEQSFVAVPPEFLAKLNPKPEKGQPDPTPTPDKDEELINFAKENLKKFLEGKYSELFNITINELNRLCKMQSEKERVTSEIEAILSDTTKYQELTQEEKEKIRLDVDNKYKGMFYSRYNKKLISFIREKLIPKINDLNNQIASLRIITDFESDEFKNAYQTLEGITQEVLALVNADENKELGIRAKFNADTQKLEITYESGIPLLPYSTQIVSDAVLNQMKKETGKKPERVEQKPTPNPVDNGTPTQSDNKELEDAKHDYLAKLEQFNDIIEAITLYNTKLESKAVFDVLEKGVIQTTIDEEREACKLDKDMMGLRLELSNLRAEFRKKYKVYVNSIPEIRDFKFKKINFGGNLTDFIAQRDELIVEAENQIIELSEQRKNATDDQAKQAITNDINLLLEYIEAQNSFVSRRLVNESVENNLDIVNTLKTRRENKKEMRERLRRIKMGQDIEKVVVQQPLENASAPAPQQEDDKDLTQPGDIKIKAGGLHLGPKKQAIKLSESVVIKEADQITVRLIKNGIKIMFSKNMREQLSKLNAKLSLVNKEQYRRRKSINIDENLEEQDIAFKKDFEMKPEDYKIEIRVPNGSSSTLLYETELTDSEHKIHR